MSESYNLDRFLSLATLFNGQFSLDLLVGLTEDKPTKILEALEEGTQKGWLTKTGPGVFCFTDMDNRQVFEKRLDQKEKERLHLRIVDHLINNTPDDDLRTEDIAYHLLCITNDSEKCALLVRAGDLYLKSFRTEQALQCYNKALEDLTAIEGKEADLLFTETAIRYSRISMARYDTQRIMTMLQEAMARAERNNARPYLAILKMHLAKNEWLRGREESAFRHFEEGLSMVAEIDNPKLLRSAAAFRIFFFYWQGRFKEIIRAYEKSVPDVERFPKGRFPLLATMMAGYCYAHCGQVTQGLGMIDAIKSYCQERGDRYISSHAQNSIGEILIEIGHLDEGLQSLESSLEEATRDRISWIWLFGRLLLAYASYRKNDNERAIALLREYLLQSNQLHIRVRSPWLLELCWAMEQGKLSRLSHLQIGKEIQKAITGQDVLYKGVGYRYQALLKKKNGCSAERVIESLNLSLKFLEESGHQIQLSNTQLELGRQYLSAGEEDKGKEILQVAYKTISSINEALFPDDLRFLVAKPPHSQELLKEILNLGQEAVTIRDNKELVQHIISTVNRITGAERGAIFLLEKKADPTRVQLRASKGLTYDDVNDPNFAPSMKMIEEVLRTGKGHIKRSSSVKGPSNKGIHSRICVPLILRNNLVGVLYHDNRLLSTAFKESDLELLAYFAGQAAIALDNATVYQDLQQRSEKLKEEKLYYKEQHLQGLHYEDIIAETPIMRLVLSEVDRVAATDITVLLIGETGVGKGLLASAIHHRSLRHKGPFIQVNLGALPESLIPSELFGHEKGAFTGAYRRRVGRFELADRGSLFLDEIGTLSTDVQTHLLLVLERKDFERLGGADTIRSDFRLIAATNRDLKREVEAGNFRADLYYRLNVFPIHVPPLRERKDDIPILAHYFLRIYSGKIGKIFDKISDEETDKLLNYDWPGNVRELENVIERGIILSSGTTFIVPELVAKPSGLILPSHGDTLEEVNRRHILKVIQKTKWKVRGQGGAAELLNIKPTTLEYKMKKLDIRRPN